MAEVAIVGGWARNLVQFRGHLIARMARSGHRVVALAPETQSPAGLSALGASYVSCPFERAGTNPVRDATLLVRLVRRFRRIRPDVVLTYNPKPLVYGSLAARLVGVPRVVALVTGLGYLFLKQGSLRDRVVRALARPLYRRALAATDVVIVQNPDDLRELVEGGVLAASHPVARVWGSGVDLNEFARAPLPDGAPVFLFVGRLYREKGVFELVEAARQVRRRYPEARIQVLGGLDPNPTGLSRAELDGLVAEGVVEYLGTTDDVRAVLVACTVFVLPSYREGTPRSVLEALAVGRPVITCDAPGCRETVIDGESGFLVPVGDSDALAAAMCRYLEQPELVTVHAERGHALAVERYDVHAVNAQMLEIMELYDRGVEEDGDGDA